MLFVSIIIPNQTSASVPTATTNPVSIVSSSKVTLNGFINPGGLKTSYWFELNEDGNIQSFGRRSRSTVGDVSVDIIQIDPDITYSVRLVVQNADGKSYGDVIGFSTNKLSTQTNTGEDTTFSNTGSNTSTNVFGKTPIVNTNYATNVTDTGVSLNGYIDPNGGSNVYRWFEWGTTQSLGNISGNLFAGTNPNYFSHGISGLERNTTYYFRAGAHSSAGTVYGSIFSFTTGTSNTITSNITPIIIVKEPSYITTDSAQLNAVAIKGGSALTNGYFEWGTSQLFGNTTQTQSFQQGSSANMTAILSNLKPNTFYSFRATIQDATSAVYKSQIVTFYTPTSTGNIVTPTNSQNGSISKKGSISAGPVKAVQKSEIKIDTTTKNTFGAAGIFFTKTSVALLGWFLSIILMIVVIAMGVMLRKTGKKDNTEFEAEGFKEFPNIPGHPINIIK